MVGFGWRTFLFLKIRDRVWCGGTIMVRWLLPMPARAPRSFSHHEVARSACKEAHSKALGLEITEPAFERPGEPPHPSQGTSAVNVEYSKNLSFILYPLFGILCSRKGHIADRPERSLPPWASAHSANDIRHGRKDPRPPEAAPAPVSDALGI